MATKVGLQNNILKIDDGTANIQYLNAGWCSMRFDSEYVFINDMGKNAGGKEYPILLSEFQDFSGTPYATEAAIATYLSDKIG